MHIVEHFKTITHHRRLVRGFCFRVGLYWQGLTHDLSKYSPSEFFEGIRYYAGTQSPNNLERKVKGYSASWLHHKGRNKHHYEYWTDYHIGAPKGTISPVKMPERYVIEMLCDRVAACRTYHKDDYTQKDALEYFQKGCAALLMHPETSLLLRRLLTMVAKKGEDYTFKYIRRHRGSLYPLLANAAPSDVPLISFAIPRHGEEAAPAAKAFDVETGLKDGDGDMKGTVSAHGIEPHQPRPGEDDIIGG